MSNAAFMNALRQTLDAARGVVDGMTVEEHQHDGFKSAQFLLDAMQTLAREQARARLNEVRRKRERAENLVLEFFQEECRLAAFLAKQQELPLGGPLDEQGDAVDEWNRAGTCDGVKVCADCTCAFQGMRR